MDDVGHGNRGIDISGPSSAPCAPDPAHIRGSQSVGSSKGRIDRTTDYRNARLDRETRVATMTASGGTQAASNIPTTSGSTLGRDAHEPWVRGPFWDVLWLQSALWLAPLTLWLAHGYADPTESPLDVLFFALTAVFWIGHRIGSTWLAYATTAYRPMLRAE